MACAIVSGYSLDCKDTVGGIKNIYITELANVPTAPGQNASGFVTSITMAAGKKFFKYALEPRGSNSLEETIDANPQNSTVAYTQTVNANFVKMQYATQQKLALIVKNRTLVIVETKAGSYFLCGLENGMEVSGGKAGTGAAMNDFQGYTLTLTGMEKEFANEVDPSIIAALQ